MSELFDRVVELAKSHVIQAGTPTEDIVATPVGSISGGLPNSKRFDFVADVAILTREHSTLIVQLAQNGGRWMVVRTLVNQLASAHPLLIDEYDDVEWRETARLQQRIAADLERRLMSEGKIQHVKQSGPRCFLNLQYGKALCDIFYLTWESDEPEPSETARLFVRSQDMWTEVPGRYHTGMRIDPHTGEIYTMIEPSSS